VGYFMTLNELQKFSFKWCERMIIFDEIERTAKEVILSHFKILSHNPPGRLKKTTKLDKDRRCSDRDSKWAPPKYESRPLPLGATLHSASVNCRVPFCLEAT